MRNLTLSIDQKLRRKTLNIVIDIEPGVKGKNFQGFV